MFDSVLKSVANKTKGCTIVNSFEFKSLKQNQLIFFLKPEIFLSANLEHLKKSLEIVEQQFSTFNIDVDGIALLSGDWLSDHEIMDRHYGYINLMSKSASSSLDDANKEIIYSHFKNDESPILGAHEVLEANPDLTPTSLDDLWMSKKSIKIRGGQYVQEYTINNTPTIVVNGFHPSQLHHYTQDDRYIAIFLICSDLPWSILRDVMIGDTFPDKAMKGSLRNTMLQKSDDIGIDRVSVANNCSHLSAGPYEALSEMNNFFSPILGSQWNLNDSNLIKKGTEMGIDVNTLSNSILNPSLSIGLQNLDLFDSTENVDTLSSLRLINI